MRPYDLILLVHVLGAVTLVGGAFMLQLLALLAARTGGPEDLATVSRQASWVGPRVFVPTAAITLLSGLWLASESGYSLREGFLLLGLLVIVASSAAGPLFLAPESKRISRLIAAEGVGCREVVRRLRRLFLVTRVELVLLVLALAGMVLKPSF